MLTKQQLPEPTNEDIAYHLDAYLEHLADNEDLSELEAIMKQTVDLIVSVERGEHY